MDPRCVGSKFDQNGDVKSLSNPFHHMQRHWRLISWSQWRKITLQLHRTTCLSTHLRLQTLSGPSWVYQKQNTNYFRLLYYYVWIKAIQVWIFLWLSWQWNGKQWGYLQNRKKTVTTVKVCKYDLTEPISVSHTTCSMFNLCWQKGHNCHNYITSLAVHIKAAICDRFSN